MSAQCALFLRREGHLPSAIIERSISNGRIAPARRSRSGPKLGGETRSPAPEGQLVAAPRLLDAPGRCRQRVAGLALTARLRPRPRLPSRRRCRRHAEGRTCCQATALVDVAGGRASSGLKFARPQRTRGSNQSILLPAAAPIGTRHARPGSRPSNVTSPVRKTQQGRSSKPVRSCSPRLGRFDSCAAPLGEVPAHMAVQPDSASLRDRRLVTEIWQTSAFAGVSDHRADDRAPTRWPPHTAAVGAGARAGGTSLSFRFGAPSLSGRSAIE